MGSEPNCKGGTDGREKVYEKYGKNYSPRLQTRFP